MNKKLVRNIILAVLAILLQGGAYYFAVKWQPETNTVDTQSEPTEEIVVFEAEDITSVEITNKNGTYVISKNDDEYMIDGMENADLNTGSLSSPISNLSKITAKRVISEDDSRAAEFGLENPLAVVKIIRPDGTQPVIMIGDEAPTGDGQYIMYESQIYLVSTYSVDYYLRSADYYKNKSIASFDFSAMSAFELYSKDECIVKIRTVNDSDTIKNTTTENLIMEKPYYEFASSEKLLKLFENITELNAVRVVEDTQENAAKYGIGKYTFKFTDNAGAHVLKLGYMGENEEIYAVYEGKNAIFAMDRTFFDIAENFDPFDYIHKFVQIYSIDDVSKVEYTAPTGSLILEIDRTDAENPKYKVNGGEVAEDKFKDAYQAVIGISFTGKATSPPGEKIGSVTYTFNDGKTDTAEYLWYGDRSYLVIKSDGTAYEILKKNFDKVADDVNAAVNESENK